MKRHYQLFPFIFFNLNLEQICFPNTQNIKKTKCILKYYMEAKNYCSKTKYSETSFLIQKQNYRQVHWMLCLKSKYIPLGAQRMLVKNVTNHNALHFELLNAMLQIGCCLASSLAAAATSLRSWRSCEREKTGESLEKTACPKTNRPVNDFFFVCEIGQKC